jgi:hypothetical protein
MLLSIAIHRFQTFPIAVHRFQFNVLSQFCPSWPGALIVPDVIRGRAGESGRTRSGIADVAVPEQLSGPELGRTHLRTWILLLFSFLRRSFSSNSDRRLANQNNSFESDIGAPYGVRRHYCGISFHHIGGKRRGDCVSHQLLIMPVTDVSMSCRVETPPKEHFDSAHKERTHSRPSNRYAPDWNNRLQACLPWDLTPEKGLRTMGRKKLKIERFGGEFRGITIDDVLQLMMMIYLWYICYHQVGTLFLNSDRLIVAWLAFFLSFLFFPSRSRSRSLHSSHTFLLGLVSG